MNSRSFYRNDLIDRLNDREDMDEDDFYEALHEEIDNMVIYYHEAKDICNSFNYDVFQEHELWGRANDWSQAGYACLYDDFMEGDYNYDDYLNYEKNRD